VVIARTGDGGGQQRAAQAAPAAGIDRDLRDASHAVASEVTRTAASRRSPDEAGDHARRRRSRPHAKPPASDRCSPSTSAASSGANARSSDDACTRAHKSATAA
jgi:hypothetical protein